MQQRLKERRIGEDEVKQVLTKPEGKFYDLRNGHQIAIGSRRGDYKSGDGYRCLQKLRKDN